MKRLRDILGRREPQRTYAASYDCTEQFEPRIPDTTVQVVEEAWDDGVWHRTYRVHRAVRVDGRVIGAFVQFGQDSNEPERPIPHPDDIDQMLDESITRQIERGA